MNLSELHAAGNVGKDAARGWIYVFIWLCSVLRKWANNRYSNSGDVEVSAVASWAHRADQ